jgi:hypothetical protein
MDKILETHYNLKNDSYQTRVIYHDFIQYKVHILDCNDKGIHSKDMQGISGINISIGSTIGIPEKITYTYTYNDKTYCFKK